MAQVFCRWVPHAWPSARRNAELFRVLQEVMPQWADYSREDFRVRRLTGAGTNSVAHCAAGRAADQREVVFRLYGHGTECLFDRSSEMAALRTLGRTDSTRSIVPKVLAEFANGRIEEYLSATTLTPESVRDPLLSKQIAVSLFKVHEAMPDTQTEDVLLERLWAWYALALSDCGPLCTESGIDVKALGPALAELEVRLKDVHSPPVAAHCALSYENIMAEPGTKEPRVYIIDYEYSLLRCPRGFDFGNHFSEWGYDYRWEDGHVQDPDRFPTQSQKENFCSSYLAAKLRAEGGIDVEGGSTSEDPRPSDADVRSLIAEADAYMPAVDLHWGLWGIVQATRNEGEAYDYAAYGAQRIRRFLDHIEGRVPGLSE